MPTYSTAQTLINRAASELGLPANFINTSSMDQSGAQNLALLNALGDDAVSVHDWQHLQKVSTFVGDGVTSSFDLPEDFGRIVNQTEWCKSDARPMDGPTNMQVWSWTQYGIVSVGVYFRYRIALNKIEVFPTPGDGVEFAFFYISKNWVQDAVDPLLFKNSVENANDVVLFDRPLMVTGLKVKFWGQKGFDTTLLQQDFNYQLSMQKGQSQGAPIINLGGTNIRLLLGWDNIPDGSWKVN